MEDFEKVYEQGRVAFEAGKVLDAERLFLKLLENHPQGYADIYNKLGIITFQKGNAEMAVAYFKKALQINSRYTEASLNLTIALNDLGRYDEAGEAFSKAAQVVRSEAKSVDPFIQGKLANEHAKLGDQYFELGLYDGALEEYRKALALRPKFVDVVTKVGITLREKGLFDEAIETFQQAKEFHPKYGPALIHLGVTYYMKGFVDLALREWEEAQRINPEGKEARVYLAMAKKEVIEEES
ncbi:MAG: tetratricopeptide repeat protein [Nitrospirae bacterium]|nr:tetratricopeptide repeat protein [Candidatus Manganitrophaceae bacterium]